MLITIECASEILRRMVADEITDMGWEFDRMEEGDKVIIYIKDTDVKRK